ncbi:nucleoside monophosphate kinase [Patescibacteria group bacterium]|nr:nucleoside monophosphate kinase [Patescibacteria group bacterium]
MPTRHPSVPLPKKQKIFLFLGPQGAGKGTQAELLAARLDIPALSTGALYRHEIEEKTRLGRLVESEVKKGLLVQDEITNALIAWRLRQEDVRKGVVLDGYPRTLAQTEALEYINSPVAVVAVTVSDAVAVQRISGRRICGKCNAHYHTIFRPPHEVGICDRCRGVLHQRPDDTPTAVKKRLMVYHENTEPILAMYDKLGKLIEVDGGQSVDDVAAKVWVAVRPYLTKKHPHGHH